MSAEAFDTAELLGSGLPPPSDRMLTTCFLAALLHAMIILGVSFSAPGGKQRDADAELQVVLVSDQVPAATTNPRAHYLSERTQLGNGNSRPEERTRIPKSSPSPLERAGAADGEGVGAKSEAAAALADEFIASRHALARVVYFTKPTAHEQAQLPLLLEKRPDLAMSANDDGIELHLRGEDKAGLWIAASTRESDIAVYLDGWRRKIERIGTVNFPDAARRRRLSGTPVVEVLIAADGKLLESRIKHTSGIMEIDEAALRILKLAAPFEPFPRELTVKHDEIRIAYEWQFLNGSPQGASVYFTEPSH